MARVGLSPLLIVFNAPINPLKSMAFVEISPFCDFNCKSKKIPAN